VDPHLTFRGALPSVWPAYARALLGRRPAHLRPGDAAPALEARAERIVAPERALAGYRRVCGFPASGPLPLTYPHVLAMPLRLALLTSPAFPVRLLGLVHLRDRITSHRPLSEGDLLDLRMTLSGPLETDRGQEFELGTEVRRSGQLAWSETSVLLARRHGAGGTKAGARARPDSPALAEIARWDFPADAGRRYARVSSDVNPIHLARLTARLFGFDRAIAHGMFSLARIAAALGPRLPDGPVTLEAAFKLPVVLPATVTLASRDVTGGLLFALRDAQGVKPHVTGTLTRAAA
jgi:MaoC dehydratase-like protein